MLYFNVKISLRKCVYTLEHPLRTPWDSGTPNCSNLSQCKFLTGMIGQFASNTRQQAFQPHDIALRDYSKKHHKIQPSDTFSGQARKFKENKHNAKPVKRDVSDEKPSVRKRTRTWFCIAAWRTVLTCSKRSRRWSACNKAIHGSTRPFWRWTALVAVVQTPARLGDKSPIPAWYETHSSFEITNHFQCLAHNLWTVKRAKARAVRKRTCLLRWQWPTAMNRWVGAEQLTLYRQFSVPGSSGWMTMYAWRKCDVIMFGTKGVSPSWNTIATMSFPMCRLRCSCEADEMVNLASISRQCAYWASPHVTNCAITTSGSPRSIARC